MFTKTSSRKIETKFDFLQKQVEHLDQNQVVNDRGYSVRLEKIRTLRDKKLRPKLQSQEKITQNRREELDKFREEQTRVRKSQIEIKHYRVDQR